MEAPSLSVALAHDAFRSQAYAVGAPSEGFVEAFVDARLEGMRRATSAVEDMVTNAPPDFPVLQVALLMLFFCAAPKADHLLRHLPRLSVLSWAPRSISFCWKVSKRSWVFSLVLGKLFRPPSR